MRVAAVVVTHNDGYKFAQWTEHHRHYRDELFLHIIVDNASDEAYFTQVRESFTDSVIVRRTSNGGCTGAYNEGIRLALANPAVEAIMLIGNDIRLESGGVTRLSDFLMSNPQYGMVAPILLSADHGTVEDFGDSISSVLLLKPLDMGKEIGQVTVRWREVGAVTGGMNLAKREFYEKVGLQDELLFMYSDEVDMAIRARRAGFKIAVTADVRSFHEHVNAAGNPLRPALSSYLICRNKVYLAWKHHGFGRALMVFIYLWLRSLYRLAFAIANRSFREHQYSGLRGAMKGLLRNMGTPDVVLKGNAKGT